MYSLLFIEDDDHIRLALSMALEDEGYDVTQAANGSSGLALFDEREFDLVLLDLRLPDLSGFDVCRALRAKSIAPIIVVTAQTDTHDLVAGLEAGADDYVTKPVVAKELAARIRAHLRRVQLHEHPAAKAERLRRRRAAPGAGHRAQGGQRGEPDEDRVPPAQRVRRPRRLGAVAATTCSKRVWGYEYLGDSRLVDAHVRRLRGRSRTIPTSRRSSSPSAASATASSADTGADAWTKTGC